MKVMITKDDMYNMKLFGLNPSNLTHLKAYANANEEVLQEMREEDEKMAAFREYVNRLLRKDGGATKAGFLGAQLLIAVVCAPICTSDDVSDSGAAGPSE